MLEGIARGGLDQVEGLIVVSHAIHSNNTRSNVSSIMSESVFSVFCPVSMINHLIVSDPIHYVERLSDVNII